MPFCASAAASKLDFCLLLLQLLLLLALLLQQRPCNLLHCLLPADVHKHDNSLEDVIAVIDFARDDMLDYVG